MVSAVSNNKTLVSLSVTSYDHFERWCTTGLYNGEHVFHFF